MNVIHDEENIIGYNDDIIKELKEEILSIDSIEAFCDYPLGLVAQLIMDLEYYDHELVYCSYHPMGAYHVERLVRESDKV